MRFGTSGVRGIYGKEIDEGRVAKFFSLGGFFVVSADARSSSLSLKSAAVSSMLSSGSFVVDIGNAPTGIAAFVSKEMGTYAVQFTASHNPPEYAGFKIFRNGIGHTGKPDSSWSGRPSLIHTDPLPLYLSAILKFRSLFRKQKSFLVVDVGNGSGHWYCSRILKSLGWRFETVHDFPDAENPVRGLEPTPESVERAVPVARDSNAIGVALDGDSDRAVFFDGEGFIGYNEAIALFALKFLDATGGRKVVTTVETGMLFDEAMREHGIDVERTAVGDIAVAKKAMETGSPLGVEQPGHYIVPSFYPAPDVFLPMLSFSSWFSPEDVREWLDSIERPVFLKEKHVTERKHDIMEKLDIEGKRIDGILAEGDGWRLLVRASGTENAIRVIAEAYDRKKARELMEYAMEKIREVEENEGHTAVRGSGKKNEAFVG